ncbi:transposon Tf2-6 polyprotein [Nephila pilipes]|uniref:Transposon Tf2-6 polyprotein n=1 Tax=Nephila pilipes TaxID=299642 RepID=A0A8X6NFU8_NEPPI|nr:transposon Tf2-6 polyprotein [Nephila pilipes]
MKTLSGLKDISVNTVRNQLEYIDLFIDGKKVKCLEDSRSELIILNKSLLPGKPSTGSIPIKSCFGNIVEAETASFNFSLVGNRNIELYAAVCQQLVRDAISSPKCLELLPNSPTAGGRAITQLSPQAKVFCFLFQRVVSDAERARKIFLFEDKTIVKSGRVVGWSERRPPDGASVRGD